MTTHVRTTRFSRPIFRTNRAIQRVVNMYHWRLDDRDLVKNISLTPRSVPIPPRSSRYPVNGICDRVRSLSPGKAFPMQIHVHCKDTQLLDHKSNEQQHTGASEMSAIICFASRHVLCFVTVDAERWSQKLIGPARSFGSACKIPDRPTS